MRVYTFIFYTDKSFDCKWNQARPCNVEFSVDFQLKMKACLPLQYTQFNVSVRQQFYKYWIFAVWKKLFGNFYSSKCSFCVQYILQYIQNLYFFIILMCSVGSICKFLVAFQLIFQYFNFVQPPISPRFFVSFLEFCSFPSVSHFSVVLFAVFLREPLFSFYIFILVKVVTYFLEFYFEFLFVLAIYY